MHPGDIVAGKYRVQNILSRTGGMLLEARHTEFDQRVVIRMLSPSLGDAKEIERFRREARTLSKLESEHVARIIDVGTHSDGSFFLVRQYLDGIDLATHLRNQGALRMEEAVLYILQACEAVQECHSHKILLRELRPGHLFLTRKRGGTPLVKIIDFGTAKLLKDAKDLPPGEGSATVMMGMSQYSSPELVRKQPVDARTDVWSLGCILYELLASIPPFQGDMAGLMLKITREDPIPLSQLRPDVPREFDQIIGWALAKDPSARFSSVYALAHALKPYTTPEGQVLIDHIGRLAHAKDDSVELSGPISPTSPLARRSAPTYERARYDDDEATVMRPFPSHDDESAFETTAFLPDSYDTGRGSVPPPSYSRPGSVPPPSRASASGYPNRSSVPPPSASRPGVSGSWSELAIDPDPAGSPYSQGSTTGAYPATTAVETRTRQRKTAMLAFGASLVLLPVLVTLLVFALRDRTGSGELAQNDAVEAQEARAATRPPEDEPPARDAPVPASASAEPNSDSKEPEVEPTAEPTVESAPAVLPAPNPNWPPPPKPSPRRRAAPPPPPPPEPDPKPEPSGGGTGTLVAIAIGGSCSFAVDGVPKGTKSSIRISVPVGPHTVSCSPKGKATRTQRVNVKKDKPGIASFRLN